jgi:hypothetical protein
MRILIVVTQNILQETWTSKYFNCNTINKKKLYTSQRQKNHARVLETSAGDVNFQHRTQEHHNQLQYFAHFRDTRAKCPCHQRKDFMVGEKWNLAPIQWRRNRSSLLNAAATAGTPCSAPVQFLCSVSKQQTKNPSQKRQFLLSELTGSQNGKDQFLIWPRKIWIHSRWSERGHWEGSPLRKMSWTCVTAKPVQ